MRHLWIGTTGLIAGFLIAMFCYAQTQATQNSSQLSAEAATVPPSVTLTWTNHPPPKGKKLTLNNVYRCTGATCTPKPPAIHTSATPITRWKDTAVVNLGVYAYAVTESIGTTEGGYSNVVRATVPKKP